MSFTVAMIPARYGSKRIPRKNVKMLCGKPLIQYTIEHAIAARSIDMVVVSTDDPDVMKIAKEFSCYVILRPKVLAGDHVITLDVVKHCIGDLNVRSRFVDYFVLLQPTVPIREIEKIDEAMKILKDTGCDSVTSYVRVDFYHPNRMKRIQGDGEVISYCEREMENVARDKLPKAYHRDGSIYAMRADLPILKNTMFGKDARAVINDRDLAVDIDTPRDFFLAEWIIENTISK